MLYIIPLRLSEAAMYCRLIPKKSGVKQKCDALVSGRAMKIHSRERNINQDELGQPTPSTVPFHMWGRRLQSRRTSTVWWLTRFSGPLCWSLIYTKFKSLYRFFSFSDLCNKCDVMYESSVLLVVVVFALQLWRCRVDIWRVLLVIVWCSGLVTELIFF